MRAATPPDEGQVADAEKQTLRVRLFGELALDLGGRPLGPIESGRSRSLLGYLVLHRDGPHARQRLAFLLWPDSTEAQARTNLRKVLHTLRRETPELESFLAITPQTLQWVSAGPLTVDVEEFGSALAKADAAGNVDDEVVALRQALTCYTDDLLEGCYDEWLIAARERLRDQYVSGLARLAGLLSQRGEHVEAVRLGRELVRCEPVREASHRLLMALYDASGDRAAAVRAYHECASTLGRELGVEPSGETVAAYDALTRLPNAVADDGTVTIGTAELVGRDETWGDLTRAWQDAASGQPRLVVVTGEPGVGKTRLVEEFAAWCAHQGACVATGRSYPTEGELGFGLAISWLRGGLRDGVRRAPPSVLTELARLLPELDRPTDSSPSVDDAEQRRRLFDAIARVVRRDGPPVLLVADDAQWSDTPSLQLLHYLLRFDPTAPLLAVATVRREDLSESHALHELLDALAAADRVTEIALARLSLAETAALARSLVGDDVASSATNELFADTDGNPLFIVESVRAGWPATTGAAALSPRLQAVVTARVRRLTPVSRDLLGVASAVGRDFPVSLLREASQLDERSLARALDEVWRRGLFREHGADGYDFSHGKVRDIVYGELEPAKRRHHHLVIAESLRRLHELAVEPVSGQIAFHYDRAGRSDEAISWYRRAAAAAQRRSANAEAIRLLDRALELVGAVPETDRLEWELEVLTALPTPLAGVDGFASDRLVATQQRALRLAGLLGVQPPPPVLRSVVMSRLCRDEFDSALVVAGQLRDEARRTDDEGLLVESTYLLGIGAFWGGQLEAARDHFAEVVTAFRPEQRPYHLVRFGQDPQIVCLSRLANTLRFLGDLDAARRARDDAVAMADSVGHPFSRGVVLIFASLLAVDLGETDRLVEFVDALRRDPHPTRPNDIKTEALAGYADIVAGNTAAGVEQLRRAIETGGAVNHAPGFRAALFRLRVAAELLAGDAECGLAAADEALRLGGTTLWEADVRIARARCLEHLGRPRPEVDAELGRAWAVAQSQGAAGPARVVEDRQRERRRAD